MGMLGGKESSIEDLKLSENMGIKGKLSKNI